MDLDDGPSQTSLVDKFRSIFFGERRDQDRATHKFEEEMQVLIDEGAERGVISSDEGQMLQSVFEFGDTMAREIMIPRTDIVAASIEITFDEVLGLSREHGHSRLPVYEDNIDNIIGILHVKELLNHWGEPGSTPLPRQMLRPPYFIPESKKLASLLAEFKLSKNHMAIVLDEYGGTEGLVTLEDIIEEIVGEIHDEFDHDDRRIISVEDDVIMVDAREHLEELTDYLQMRLPGGDYESVGGFLIEHFGRVPQPKETLSFAGLEFTIHSADERKIKQVKIKHPPLPHRDNGGK